MFAALETRIEQVLSVDSSGYARYREPPSGCGCAPGQAVGEARAAKLA